MLYIVSNFILCFYYFIWQQVLETHSFCLSRNETEYGLFWVYLLWMWDLNINHPVMTKIRQDKRGKIGVPLIVDIVNWDLGLTQS
jgi:hypothetical protein